MEAIDLIELIGRGEDSLTQFKHPLLASFATKGNELPYRGIGTGIRRALAAVPALELESDHERNLFTARIPRREQ